MMVVAGLLLAGLTPFVFESGFHPQAWIPSLLLAAFARYGRTTVFVEHRPRSGELTLVTRRLFGKQRESFAADAIEAVELQRIESKGLALAEMYDVVFRFSDGSLAHVFGRPLGLEPARARAVVSTLERIVDDARTGMLRVRIEPLEETTEETPEETPLSDEASPRVSEPRR